MEVPAQPAAVNGAAQTGQPVNGEAAQPTTLRVAASA